MWQISFTYRYSYLAPDGYWKRFDYHCKDINRPEKALCGIHLTDKIMLEWYKVPVDTVSNKCRHCQLALERRGNERIK